MWSWLQGYKYETYVFWLVTFLGVPRTHTHTHTHTDTHTLIHTHTHWYTHTHTLIHTTHTHTHTPWRTSHKYSISSTSPYYSVPVFNNSCSCFRVQFIRMWGTLRNPYCLIPRMKFKSTKSWNRAIYIQTRLRAGRPGNDISIPDRCDMYVYIYIFPLPSIQTASGTNRPSSSIDTGDSSHGGKSAVATNW